MREQAKRAIEALGPPPVLQLYIDTDSGNDQAAGDSASRALKTYAEARRRMQPFTVIPAVEINLVSDLSEPLEFTGVIQGTCTIRGVSPATPDEPLQGEVGPKRSRRSK